MQDSVINLQIPAGYSPKLNLLETERAIKTLKDGFERRLARVLKLERVSAPLFVEPETGLNDNLSGKERPVSFDVLETGAVVEIVRSLAKWKRHALARYGMTNGHGLSRCSGIVAQRSALPRTTCIVFEGTL